MHVLRMKSRDADTCHAEPVCKATTRHQAGDLYGVRVRLPDAQAVVLWRSVRISRWTECPLSGECLTLVEGPLGRWADGPEGDEVLIVRPASHMED